MPLYRNIYTFINTLIVGYWNTKYIGIGPYYKLASFNKLEGFRMQLGGRTTTNVSRTVRVGGYVAYGTRDEDVKGGGSVEVAFNRHLTRKLTLTARHDVMQLGAGQNALTESNILSSILSRGDQRLSMVNRGEAVYEHEWCHGVSTFAGARMQRIFANRYVPMLRPGGVPVNSVSDAAVHVGVRLSKNETVYRMPFDKQSMGSVCPILTLGFSAGIPGALHGSYEYYRLEGSLRYRPELPPVGYSDITVQGGRIFGKVPYQLLKLHEGNGTYLRPLRLLVHEFLRIRFRRVGVVVLGTPLQRRAAGPPAADQKAEMARSAGLQRRMGYAFARKQRVAGRNAGRPPVSRGHDLGVGPLCRGGVRRGEHLQTFPRGLHLAAHPPRPNARAGHSELRRQFESAAQILTGAVPPYRKVFPGP